MLQLDEKIIEQIKQESKKAKKLTLKNPDLSKKFDKELKRIEKKAIEIARDYGEKLNELTNALRKTSYQVALRQEGFGEKRFNRIMHRITIFNVKAEIELAKIRDSKKAFKWLEDQLEKHCDFEKEFSKASAKKYLSNQERQDIVSFIAIGNNIQYYIDNHLYLSEAERKYLEESVIAIGKFYKQLIERVGEDERKRIENEVKHKELILMTTTQMNIAKKRLKSNLTWEFESTNERDDVIEGLIESYCRGCNKHPIKNCGIRKMFMKQEIEPMNYFGGKGECQYKYSEKR